MMTSHNPVKHGTPGWMGAISCLFDMPNVSSAERHFMVHAVIAVKPARENGNDRWIVIRCSVLDETSALEITIPFRSGKHYESKHAAVTEMKGRIWKVLVEKGHRMNDEQVIWDIHED